jgi:multicomponent Na+:H+ antiporter subunit D
MLPDVWAGRAPEATPLQLTPAVALALRADALGALFALLASGLWIVTTVYSIGYMRAEREHAQTRYFAAFALSLFATIGLALSANLLTFYMFYEILTVATYPLVVHRETPEAARAGRLYLAYTLGAGMALLAAVAWTARLAGHLDFVAGGMFTAGAPPPATVWALFGLFVLGCGVKAALVPLHTWLPVAMIAPTPVSALLHAVAVVKAGVFGLLRVTGFVLGPSLLGDSGAGAALTGLACVTILVGSLAALAQDNLKRLLAFSTVSQLSYVILGGALGTTTALTGGIMHIVSHALLKITLFFCAGAFAVTAHVERVSEMAGLGRRMPMTTAAFAASALMLAGLPPGVAFVSKWRLLGGALEAGEWVPIAVLLASALLNLAYFVPIVIRSWGRADASGVAEAPASILVPLLVTAAAGLVMGLAPDVAVGLLSLAGAAARSVTGQP